MADLQKKPVIPKEEDFGDDVNEWLDWGDVEEPEKDDDGVYMEPSAGSAAITSKTAQRPLPLTIKKDLAEESASEPAVHALK